MADLNDEHDSPSSPESTNPEQPMAAIDIQHRQLQLWPAVVILVMACGLITFFHFRAGDDAVMATMPLFMGPMATAAVLVLWWLLGSGLAWKTRMKGILVLLATFGALFVASHSTMPQFIVMVGVPTPILLCTLWAILARKRRPTILLRGVATIASVSVALCLSLRYEGISGNGVPSMVFRWSPTFDDRAAAYLETAPVADSGANRSAEPLIASALDCPEFRGTKRDGIVRHARIRLDWDANPPTLLWKHPVGLGWSSFAVVGDFAFTQEQRRDDEVVVCYDAATGRQIWAYTDTTRFSESMGGDGPRATPTFYDGRIYALGANGILNCLDPISGERIWSTNILGDSHVENLTWGMAGSPLVFNDLVVVNPGGSEGRGLVAYNRFSGKQIWAGGSDKAQYSSPQLSLLHGVEQVLIFDRVGLAGHDAKTGRELWKFVWPNKMPNNAIQPHVLNESDILIGTTIVGSILLRVQNDSNGWTVTEQWTSHRLKLNFNDLVIKDQHAYGLDQGILACINLADGKRAWKDGRYGYGQVLLIDEDNVLLILTEKGEVVLVEASPKSHHEIARFQAVAGKTWNHPVIANGRLFVRNSEEAACYEISPIAE